ncbi:MAG TPA: PPC domain-containing protein [Nitrospiria bacterium]|nr:PPC domain-containing protein [Nitrospiria bacterium]
MERICPRNVFISVLFVLMIAVQGCSDGDGTTGTNPAGKTSTGTITGTAEYEDREYDQNGFTGQKTLKPIRFADVELVRNSDGTVLASTTTNANGSFSLTFTNSGTPGVYVRVLSRTGDPLVKVQVTNLAGALYAIISNTLDETTTSSFIVSLTAPVVTTDQEALGGAFHIMDSLASGSEFVRGLSGTTPPLIKARWELGSVMGTYYNTDTEQIDIIGGNGLQQGDHDEYDDTVLLHEYGHHIANSFSKDDSRGGIHYLTDNTQDIRLAWSEGWATFFGGAVLGSSAYIDTVGGDPPGNGATSIDLETRSSNSPLIYTANEGAVTTVLWDIFDQSTSEAFDIIGGKMAQIWDVFANSVVIAASADIEDFWNGWFNRGHGSATEMQAVTTDRQMEFIQDPSGSNNQANCSTAVTIGSSIHETLYSSTSDADVDYFCLNLTQGTSYTIETRSLSNGADTFLELLNAQLNVLSSNDNGTNSTDYSLCQTSSAPNLICPANNATNLASKISFTPSSTGQYFARVTRSSKAPLSAGTFGSYNFRVTSP